MKRTSIATATVPDFAALARQAARLRSDVVRMIAHAGSGHNGGALSAADMITYLYFHQMRVDPAHPDCPDRDRFVLSKGHCCPILYAALAARGFFPCDMLWTLRDIGSRLQGHPDMTKTPGVDMTTGSLGQGISAAVGMAVGGKLDAQHFRVYCMVGDGEIQEGQVWEAAMAAAHHRLSNLTVLVDNNKMETDGETRSIINVEPIEDRWRAFGWAAERVDGHDMRQVHEAIGRLVAVEDRPSVLVADTIKGKGVSFMEGRVEWHSGPTDEEQTRQALRELLSQNGDGAYSCEVPLGPGPDLRPAPLSGSRTREPIANRVVYGQTLVELGEVNPDLVVLDADISVSTNTCQFARRFPDRFFNIGVAEQNMIGIAAGLATTGKLLFASTFAIFASLRASEQVRTSIAYPRLNVKIVANNAGVEICGDGVTHQAVEDFAVMRAIANMTVVSPSDPVTTRKAVHAIAEYDGPVYMRLGRQEAEYLHDDEVLFELGRMIQLRAGGDVTIIATGHMVGEAIRAADELAGDGIDARVLDCHTIKPIDVEAIVSAAQETRGIVTVEDHNIVGGLGSAVCEVVAQECPTRVYRVGLKDRFASSGRDYRKLLATFEIDAATIVREARRLLGVEHDACEEEQA